MRTTELIKWMMLFVACFGFESLHAQCASSKATSSAQRTNYVRTSYRSAPAGHTKDIVGLAAANHDLSILVTAVKAAGLVETLQGKGPFTVFAPTNRAFDALPAGTLDYLLRPENKDALVKVLTYHVVPGRVEANDLRTGRVSSVEGSKIAVDVDGGTPKINDALVIKANQRAVNGVVHPTFPIAICEFDI